MKQGGAPNGRFLLLYISASPSSEAPRVRRCLELLRQLIDTHSVPHFYSAPVCGRRAAYTAPRLPRRRAGARRARRRARRPSPWTRCSASLSRAPPPAGPSSRGGRSTPRCACRDIDSALESIPACNGGRGRGRASERARAGRRDGKRERDRRHTGRKTNRQNQTDWHTQNAAGTRASQVTAAARVEFPQTP